ncbi:type I methionyl aminopeptidase [Tsukamurella sp. 8F]|uniref:type I methionyl aminopeptidase n=1 Tax=unclassified Tsukamurella TaxID=2633480 RepID=UPI0023B9104A|nr:MULTISPECIES: type I methionyl aminopeptidase [unclassified Tsukamurella]MDF0529768.1 type I methionyl aminopeptidase [Tsukamurella sp. 8J]MDF0586053.1 type I methionyl aminopeptidase [Tsukamurella sp. 8F]
MMELKTPSEVEKMRVTGGFIAELLDALTSRAQVGVNVLDLEDHARGMLAARGAESCYWDYAPSFGCGPFRNVTCLSVNDACLHGLPRDHILTEGDVLSVDIAVSIDGWVADAARTVVIGPALPEDRRLIATTEAALDAAIAAAGPGAKLGDVSHAIGEVLQGAGYKVNTQFGGHGLGRTMHEDPHIPNLGRPGRGLTLRPGMTFAFEPWQCATTDKVVFDDDGWTIRSADGSRASHSEHTVAITDDGARILTLPL